MFVLNVQIGKIENGFAHIIVTTYSTYYHYHYIHHSFHYIITTGSLVTHLTRLKHCVVRQVDNQIQSLCRYFIHVYVYTSTVTFKNILYYVTYLRFCIVNYPSFFGYKPKHRAKHVVTTNIHEIRLIIFKKKNNDGYLKYHIIIIARVITIK